MPRESENYRSYIEQLNRDFPDALTLSTSEVAQYLKKSTRTIQRWKIPFTEGEVTKVVLAKWLCKHYG